MTDAVMTAIASVWDNKAKAYAKGTDRSMQRDTRKSGS